MSIEESIARIEDILKYINWQRCLNKGGSCIIEYDAETHRNIDKIRDELRNIKYKFYTKPETSTKEDLIKGKKVNLTT